MARTDQRGRRHAPMGQTPGGIEYIQQNLDHELTLAELAGLVYMSPYHFARLFKRSTGMPPHRFVIRQRITRACAILATPELSITQISRMVGFRTPSHFTTVFRGVTGITPKGYRTGTLSEDRPGREGGGDGLHCDRDGTDASGARGGRAAFVLPSEDRPG